MYLAVSLFLGLLYVLPCQAASAVEYQNQSEILTKQYTINLHQQSLPRLDEITIDQLRGLFDEGALTSEDLVHACPLPYLIAGRLLIGEGLHQASG